MTGHRFKSFMVAMLLVLMMAVPCMALEGNGGMTVMVYPEGNEYDPPENTGSSNVARYSLKLDGELSHNGFFINGEIDTYFGDTKPSQGGDEQSWSANPMFANLTGRVGYIFTKDVRVFIKSGRVTDFGEQFDGDHYYYNGFGFEVRHDFFK